MGGRKHFGKLGFSEAYQNRFRECFRHGKKSEEGMWSVVSFLPSLKCEGSNVLKLSFSV